MRKMILLALIPVTLLLSGFKNEPEGFMSDPWGYRVGDWLKDNPGAERQTDEAGFVWYTPARPVSLGGLSLKARYGFWKDKLTEVRITFSEAAAPRVKEYLFGRYGEVPDNGNLMYTWFGYTTEVHLNALENDLRFVSHDLGQKAETRIKRGAPESPASDEKSKAKKKGKKKQGG